jgi:hypothetical protein
MQQIENAQTVAAKAATQLKANCRPWTGERQGRRRHRRTGHLGPVRTTRLNLP